MKGLFFLKKSLKYVLIICVAFLAVFQFLIVKSGETNAEIIDKKIHAELTNTFETDGNGVYFISSAQDLKTLSEMKTFSSSAIFRQTANIDLGEELFTPIGTKANGSFSGTYDGGGFSISNIKIETSNNEYTGLFLSLSGGTIKNVILKSGSVMQTTVAEYTYAGALVGMVTRGTIINCYNLGCIVGNIIDSSYNYYPTSGGLIGQVEHADKLYGLLNSSLVYAQGAMPVAGGIVGEIISIGTGGFSCCQNNGQVQSGDSESSSFSIAGGIAGLSLVCISDSLNTANIFAWAQTTTNVTQQPKAVLSPNLTLNKNPQINGANDEGEGYILIWLYEKITTKEKSAFAGGICGYFYNAYAISCVNKTGGIYGGSEEYTVDLSLRIGVNDQYVISTYWWYSEHYNLTATKYMTRSFDIGIIEGSGAHIDCYSSENLKKDNSPILTLNGKAVRYSDNFVDNKAQANPYHSTDVNSNKNTNIYSAIKDGRITAEFSKNGDNGVVETTSPMNYLRYALLFNCGGTFSKWDNADPVIKNDYYRAKTYKTDNGHQLDITFSFDYANIFPNIVFATSYKNITKTYSCILPNSKIESITQVQGSSNEIPSTLDSNLWGCDESINGGYPYLKEFYWQHNIQEPQ